jgi:hypothetical protein
MIIAIIVWSLLDLDVNLGVGIAAYYTVDGVLVVAAYHVGG